MKTLLGRWTPVESHLFCLLQGRGSKIPLQTRILLGMPSCSNNAATLLRVVRPRELELPAMEAFA